MAGPVADASHHHCILVLHPNQPAQKSQIRPDVFAFKTSLRDLRLSISLCADHFIGGNNA